MIDFLRHIHRRRAQFQVSYSKGEKTLERFGLLGINILRNLKAARIYHILEKFLLELGQRDHRGVVIAIIMNPTAPALVALKVIWEVLPLPQAMCRL